MQAKSRSFRWLLGSLKNRMFGSSSEGGGRWEHLRPCIAGQKTNSSSNQKTPSLYFYKGSWLKQLSGSKMQGWLRIPFLDFWLSPTIDCCSTRRTATPLRWDLNTNLNSNQMIRFCFPHRKTCLLFTQKNKKLSSTLATSKTSKV